jgi:hypothetical protein
MCQNLQSLLVFRPLLPQLPQVALQKHSPLIRLCFIW